MATELVDDTNPRVQYQAGWIWDQGVAEVDATRHGAAIAGIVAYLSFTGTGVRVIGTLGDSNTYGQPKTDYWVDGNLVGSYSAPHTAQTTYNVTFFTMENLSSGDHIVRINNTDGTHPNTFWLDYFLIDKQPVATTTSTSTTAHSPTQPANVQPTTTVNNVRPVTTTHTQPTVTVNVLATTTSTSSHTATSIQSNSQTTPTISSQSSLTNSTTPASSSASSITGSSVAAIQYVTSVSGTETIVSPVSNATPVGAAQTSAAGPTNSSSSDAASTSQLNVGVIAGAAVAGVAILAILVIVFLCLRRRRVSATQAKTATPFDPTQHPAPRASGATAPAMRYNSANAAAVLPVSHASHSEHPPASPSEVASESVGDHSEFYSLSASSGSALLSPQGRSTSPTRAPPPSTSYHPSATSEKGYGTPSLGFSTDPSTRPASLYTPSTPHPPPSPAFSNASGATLIPPAAAIPPGAWHAPPDSHGRAHTLLRSLFSRSGSRTVPSDELPVASRDVDSGLRLYDDVVLPPPYTQD
ncbi:uncharacterized protein TRAVEDRAFT_17947 [Trametes versicolor FP-101664 SS1]|uniref:uncharacterized protein n=1 Tax=Trametes versicolor (strain FP-101664) TaxID=717944 RepID=UPI0004624057|nr:uncharacterized protein TRAVEDRAFT_17947 [Trametes versicolor FP-101664 SS1]EIW61138.1 hypothetical protein TRAVEDRAFT_17947 [Trametes versicolor FP-101664 SS1]